MKGETYSTYEQAREARDRKWFPYTWEIVPRRDGTFTLRRFATGAGIPIR